MRFFFRQHIPHFQQLALVESGQRHVIEQLLPRLYSEHAGQCRIDLITCYPGEPKGWQPDRGRVYRVADYPNPAAREQFYHQLRANQYQIVGILCTGLPIMTKWKWVLAHRLPAKLFIANENSDFFWFDYSNWRIIREFVLVRAGLHGSDAIRTLARVAVFPFTLAFLLLYAAAVHLRRKVRA